jgi:hypothetical protein
MMLATGYRCASTGIDRERVRDVVLKYLSDNPEKKNLPASELANHLVDDGISMRQAGSRADHQPDRIDAAIRQTEGSAFARPEPLTEQ